ncbi:cation:proton antiporter [Spirillospora sp. NPDC047279]|uniref:cation:proton antiporter n=1 Tax=Spirillospora sp. NPDC047279 TaxID=3155478 RepID=UPI0033CB22B3
MAPVEPIAPGVLLVFLLQLGLLLALALGLGRLAARLGMPPIVGELCAGVLLGPSVLANAAPGFSDWLLPRDPGRFHLLDAVGHVGVLLLVGVTGMHVDLRLVRRQGVTAAWISMMGVTVSLGLGISTGLALPGSLIPEGTERSTFALFIGVAMAVSAIPVIAKTLMELRLVHRTIGQLILCAVMVDDIVGWLLLSVVAALATSGVRGSDLGFTLGGVVVCVLAAILVRPLLRVLLRATERQEDGGPTVALVAVLVLLASAGTQALGLEAVFGAFVCGIVINGCGVVTTERLAPLRTTVLAVLAPLFFATAGLRMDLTALADPVVLLTGLWVLAAAVLGKFAGAYLGSRLGRLGHWEALAVGAGMNARGVIEVIIAMVGLRLGVLGPEMFTVIVLVAIVTSLMAPPLLRYSMKHVEHTAEELLRLPEAERAPT